MTKLLGSCLILLAAFLSGLKILEPAGEHIRLLEEGDLLYRILESEIRNTGTPLPLLFGEMSDRTNTLWHDFFLNFPLHCQKIQRKVFLSYMRIFSGKYGKKHSQKRNRDYL